jgi:hypothetical protein
MNLSQSQAAHPGSLCLSPSFVIAHAAMLLIDLSQGYSLLMTEGSTSKEKSKGKREPKQTQR